MKIATSFAFALTLSSSGCTDDVDPPENTSEAGSTTDADMSSTGEPGTAPDEDGTSTGGDAVSDDGSSEGASDTGTPQEGLVEYFRGVSENYLPDGTHTGTDEIIARREMVPPDSQVLETLYLVAEDGTWQRFDLIQEVDLEAQTFTSAFETDFGNLVVEGEYLSGEDWAWDAWRSRSTYVDGFSEGWTVLSDDQLNPDGSHEADKGVYDPEDTLMFVIEERIDAIDEDEYEAAVAELP